jgi:nucleotide-binding universal stress UspA family protein
VSGVRRVIVGASGSPGSLRALRYAEDLARHSDATLTPVMAWVPPGGEAAARQPCPPLIRIWQDAAWQRLWAALEGAWGKLPEDVPVEPAVQRGQPGPVLVAIACRPDDLLIVGAGRRGGLARVWRGRVGRYCMAHAQCPVLAVPPAVLAQQAGRGLHGWAFRRRALSVDRLLGGGGSVTA